MPWLAPLTLDGREKGRFLAADVGARPSSDLDVEFETRPSDVGAEETRNPCLVDGAGQSTLGHRVFAPYVGETLVAPVANPAMVIASMTANGSPSIRIRSLKVPGSDSSPLAMMYFTSPPASATPRHLIPMGKAAPTSTSQTRFVQRAHDIIPPHRDGFLQAGIAAALPVGIEALRVDLSDPAEETQVIPVLMDQTRGQLVECETNEPGGIGRGDVAIAGSCSVGQCGRSPVTLAETGARRPADPRD